MTTLNQELEARLAKLPEWARMEFHRLRNRVDALERDLQIARCEAPAAGCTGKVMADNMGQTGFPLHDRARVTFKLATGGQIACMLRDGGETLDINSLAGGLSLLPRAANSVYVKVTSY